MKSRNDVPVTSHSLPSSKSKDVNVPEQDEQITMKNV